MSRKYDLLPDECLILKGSSVMHGFGLMSSYTDELVLTNQCLIWIRCGMFNNVKGTIRFPLNTIKQAIVGEAPNGGKSLEIYYSGGIEEFMFQGGNDRKYKLWAMAINDRFKPNSEMHDYDYYQNFIEDSDQEAIVMSQIEETEEKGEDSENFVIDSQFIGNVAKSVLKSGKLSPEGIIKGVEKAANKKAKKDAFSGLSDELKDDLGITDIQDDVEEFKNDVRETFGLKPKTTRRMIEARKEAEKEKALNAAFNNKVAQARQMEQTMNRVQNVSVPPIPTVPKVPTTQLSVDEQIATMKKLKELLDAQVITKEEFEIKKKEVMGF